ncbi:glycosyltransferase family 2 protein [Desulfosporosinus sp. OT]|uniref:glycosyltransferase family 2 protein n=1 Tax=Desulfosporosinus sp. OT TaxID=913865 RepID=UPI000223A938|nr:glycosyltransferase family 2 protein [Desulfosporosinus sp. OT]EGW38474.1 glycosyl transferase 2 family protein [Desulfosporosinus sp. OT]
MSQFVSVIMPAYNAEKYIEKAINSVLNQSYDQFELIVIDDGSEDNTAEIIKAMVIKDKRVHFFRNEKNRGVSASRNLGIAQSIGDWIAFLDSDDMWRSEKLEKQINLIRNNEHANLIYTGLSFMDENDNPNSYVLKIPELVKYKDLLKQNIIACSSVLVKKQCLSGLKMERDDMHEDFAMWLKILKTESYAYGINEPLLIYRLSKNSKSGNKIKAAKMTFMVYRHIGLNIFQSAYFMLFYTFKNIKKYRKLNCRHCVS